MQERKLEMIQYTSLLDLTLKVTLHRYLVLANNFAFAILNPLGNVISISLIAPAVAVVKAIV